MARYIDADAEIKKLTERHCKQDCIENHKCLICLVNDIQQYLDLTAETADVKPVVHAHWVITYETTAGVTDAKCSNCGWQSIAYECDIHDDPDTNFCPHCGAVMDEEVDNG